MPRPGYDEVLLVTGYPAFGARQLVTQILREQPGALVYAVVKANLAAQAEEHLASLDAGARQRVVLLDGDAAHMSLGLSGAEFRGLAAEVDRIHHAAQVTYPGVDRETARQVNLGATREALELARACGHLRAFIHHSTAFVAGDRTGIVYENELAAGQRFRNAVEETKATAEKLVQGAMGRLPALVVRPALVVGDSRSGEVDRLDGPYLMVLLILSSPADVAIPLPSRGDALLHMVPVDYVAAAAHALGRDGRAVGHTFHLVDDQPLTGKQVFDLVASAGGRRSPRGFLPANLTRLVLNTPGLERFARSPRLFFEQLITAVRFDTTNTRELLGDTAIRCPPFAGYVDALVAFARTRAEEGDFTRSRRPDPRAEHHDDLAHDTHAPSPPHDPGREEHEKTEP
jgi:thioester reductase-like protein